MGEFTFTAELFRWPCESAWHFVAVPEDLADDIRVLGGPPRGFGSVRVEVTVGSTTWLTSVFPGAKRCTYVLPVKKEVRRAEGLAEGDPVAVALRILEP